VQGKTAKHFSESEPEIHQRGVPPCQNAICTLLRCVERNSFAADEISRGISRGCSLQKKIMMASKAWKVSTADPRWNRITSTA